MSFLLDIETIGEDIIEQLIDIIEAAGRDW